jgi:beta-lactam-binding protein with PASTA domain
VGNSRFRRLGLNPMAKGIVLGAVAGVVACAALALWAHFVLDFEVETGLDTVIIPEGLEGKRFDRAQAELEVLGLTDVRAPGASYYFGTPTRVEAVVPRPGTEISKDSTVTLLPRTASGKNRSES